MYLKGLFSSQSLSIHDSQIVDTRWAVFSSLYSTPVFPHHRPPPAPRPNEKTITLTFQEY